MPSQQRRLRHLRNIAAQNIVNRNGHQLLDTYFTLHLCNAEKIYKEFYGSEVVKNSLIPKWRSLDFGIMPDRLDTSVSCFVVKIWGGKEDIYQMLIEWKVCLDGLKYLAEEIIRLEATGFTTGDQLEAFNCIPVDSAVTVECDEQVLGEFEEFSQRIYALNENVSSFHQPRRSSDK
ncbi:UV radiation resistance-associated gene protein [Heterocephalus glaber]|uniref:UV radiation resistance-associated gene protein n=1 Tax=Heterocephalus glaber TaxID=10181 RepID=G5CA10_HETGA|nr:UV radiation resistance-associated gene protein [Heterocephalus glaber]